MDLYTETILDHFQYPHHAGRLEAPSMTVVEYNPTCGDKIVLDVQWKGSKVTAIGFEGTGCAISQAAMSLLADATIRRSKAAIQKLTDKDIYRLLGIAVSPSRVKCALLGLSALKRAVSQV